MKIWEEEETKIKVFISTTLSNDKEWYRAEGSQKNKRDREQGRLRIQFRKFDNKKGLMGILFVWCCDW